MAHTPGPWEVDGVEIYPVNGHRACDAICAMQPGFLDADAALIAAAPELLAAIEDLYEAYGKAVTSEDWDADTTRAAAAAIAKATGAA